MTLALPTKIERVCCPYDGDGLVPLHLRRELDDKYSYHRDNGERYFGPARIEKLIEFLADPSYLSISNLVQVSEHEYTGNILIKYKHDLSHIPDIVQAFFGEDYEVSYEVLSGKDYEDNRFRHRFRAVHIDN